MKKYALVIGINDYIDRDNIQPLRYAVDDATLVLTFLASSGFKVDALIDSKATFGAITDKLYQIKSLLQSGDVFLFYFSGHGYQYGAPGYEAQYLLPRDVKLRALKDGFHVAIPVRSVHECTKVSGVSRVIVLDACRGQLTSHKGLQEDMHYGTKDILTVTREAPKDSPLVIVCSCHPNERAYEDSSLEGGIFTRAMISVFEEYRSRGITISFPDVQRAIGMKAQEILTKSNLPDDCMQSPWVEGSAGGVVLVPGVEPLPHEEQILMMPQEKTCDLKRQFFDVRTIFERPVLPQQEESLCRFMAEIRTNEAMNSMDVSLLSHICLCLDLSGSMSENGKYELLQKALCEFMKQVTKKMLISVVAFSEGADEIVYVAPKDQLNAQILLGRLEHSPVKFGRSTKMAAGLQVAEQLCKVFLSKHPEGITRIYIMTDGQVHDRGECQRFPARFIKMGIEVHAFGFGHDYDHEVLREVTQGCIGGTVKAIKDLTGIGFAFSRAGETTTNIFATDLQIRFCTAPSVLCNQVFLFRPRELDTSNYITSDSTEWGFSGWSNFEKKRLYAILFETRLPKQSAIRTPIGFITLEGKVGNLPVKEQFSVAVGRSEDTAGCSRLNTTVQRAFDTCEFQNSTDPQLFLKAIMARRDIFIMEDRDVTAIREIEGLIEEVKKTGRVPKSQIGDPKTIALTFQ